MKHGAFSIEYESKKCENADLLLCMRSFVRFNERLRRAPFQLFFPFLFSVHRIEFNDSNLLLLPSPFFFVKISTSILLFSFYSDIYIFLCLLFSFLFSFSFLFFSLFFLESISRFNISFGL